MKFQKYLSDFFKKDFFLKVFFFAFLVFLSLNIRVLLAQLTFGFHEYESVFLYASDIAMVLFLTLSFPYVRKINFLFSTYLFTIIIFLFFCVLSIIFAPLKLLALYNFTRLILLILSAFSVSSIILKKISFRKVFFTLAILGILEAVLGFLQFNKQGNLGLGILGEPPIALGQSGTSAVFINSSYLMRAYGTFPHPNVLSAFLLLSLFSLYYFWLKRPSEWKIFSSVRNLMSDMVIGVGIFITFFGLLISFSRTSWIIAVLMTFGLGLFLILKRKYFIQAVRLIFLTLAVTVILVLNFKEFVIPRANLRLNEPAVAQRLNYNLMALNLIGSKPFGIGIGNQVYYSAREMLYQKFGFTRATQWQPIHNIYLLIASEIGVLGLISFLVFIAALFLNSKSQISNNKQISNSNYQNFKGLNLKNWNLFGAYDLGLVISKAILLSLLLFGFFDHFLWTLEQGRVMLWIVIGMVISSLDYYKTAKLNS